jgi:hypothetical protein
MRRNASRPPNRFCASRRLWMLKSGSLHFPNPMEPRPGSGCSKAVACTPQILWNQGPDLYVRPGTASLCQIRISGTFLVFRCLNNYGPALLLVVHGLHSASKQRIVWKEVHADKVISVKAVKSLVVRSYTIQAYIKRRETLIGSSLLSPRENQQLAPIPAWIHSSLPGRQQA